MGADLPRPVGCQGRPRGAPSCPLRARRSCRESRRRASRADDARIAGSDCGPSPREPRHRPRRGAPSAAARRSTAGSFRTSVAACAARSRSFVCSCTRGTRRITDRSTANAASYPGVSPLKPRRLPIRAVDAERRDLERATDAASTHLYVEHAGAEDRRPDRQSRRGRRRGWSTGTARRGQPGAGIVRESTGLGSDSAPRCPGQEDVPWRNVGPGADRSATFARSGSRRGRSSRRQRATRRAPTGCPR